MGASVRRRVRPLLQDRHFWIQAGRRARCRGGRSGNRTGPGGADIRRSEGARQYRTGHRQSQRRAGNHPFPFQGCRGRTFRRRPIRVARASADCEVPQRCDVQQWRVGIGNVHVYLIGAHRGRRPSWIHQRSRRVPDDHAPGRAPGVDIDRYGLLPSFHRW